MDSQTTLWYRSPATDFDHALPVGNGRIGGMLFGDPEHEVIKLNEDSVWSGGRRERNNPDAYEGLLEIRKLLAEEHIQAAEAVAFEKMQGVTPNARHYMPLGNLEIHQKIQGKARQYCRSLDLEQALAAVQFNVNEVNYIRELFVSYPDQIMVLHIAADQKGCISLSVGIDGREDDYDDCRPCAPNTILYTGGTGGKHGIGFAAALTGKQTGGTMRTLGGQLVIENADEVTLLLSVATSFYHGDDYEEAARMDVAYAQDCTYEELLYRHLSDYQKLFRRVRLNLPDNSEGNSSLPTDERLQRLRGDEGDHKECKLQIHDGHLAVLYFNYGRYLMIAGSRPAHSR